MLKSSKILRKDEILGSCSKRTKMPLCTKVRWKLLLLTILFIIQGGAGSQPKCDKTPLGQLASKTPGDNGFAVSVAGSPNLYRPSQTYTVTLSGNRASDEGIGSTPIKFIDFTLVAESDLPATEVPNLGTFQLMATEHAMSKFSHRCSHAVKATSAISKDEVKVLWTSPEHGAGCIQLKAMVVERKDLWFMDDGSLTYTICEDSSPIGAQPLVEPCCACDEVKYEVIFEGLWSRHTHPKDYPIDEWKTQFSHMIGASHSIDYDLWKYGELASPALTMLGVTGQTKKLEMDMKRSSKNIRSVIKARGLQQRSNVVGRTFAVFRMDPTNHLFSLVSKMIPSPDWIVGVSLENLCLANCSWVDSRVVDLYPWDLGIRSGLSYNYPGEETMPKESIHRITGCNPDDERSPFYDPTCAPLKPVARLHILKQREYKKLCPVGQANQGLPLNPLWENPELNGGDSNVYSGSGIGPSQSDGQTYLGYNERTRNDDYNNYNSNSRQGDDCRMSDWTSWSECSGTCGQGSHSRTRVLVDARGSSYCSSLELFQKNTCNHPNACPPRSFGGGYDPFYAEDGYTSTWSRRGLSSDNLKKEVEPIQDTKSYTYGGNNAKQGVSSSYMHGMGSSYSDPYNKLSGYAKQKGYPPDHNKPGTSKYNPYKAMGYYGYTYGGPPTGHYSNNAHATTYQDTDLDLIGEQLQGDSSGNCLTEEWGSWSECSSACGEGVRSRKRYYASQDTSTCSEDLYQTQECREDSGCEQYNPLPTPDSYVQQPSYNKEPYFNAVDPQCAVAEWSGWSPCSVTCGQGYNIRTRVFTLSFVPNRVCEGVRLTEKQTCTLDSCPGGWMEYYDDEELFEDEASNQVPITVEVDNYPVKNKHCLLEPEPGQCRIEKSHWYYDLSTDSCKEFKYSGCGGNKNNFRTLDECMQSCQDNRASVFKDLMPLSLVRADYVPEPVPCKAGEWTAWSSCSASCGRGWMTKTRQIYAQPQNGGRVCPRKLEKRKKCRGDMCATNLEDWYQGNWRMLQDNEDTNN